MENNLEHNIKPSNTRLVVSALLTGKALKSREIAAILSQSSEKEIKTGSISSILSKISNENKCDLGFFICKSKQGNALVYKMVKEALVLTEESAYGLTLKKGKERYLLSQTIEKYPDLKKYVSCNNTNNKPVVQIMKKIAESGKLINIKSYSNNSIDDKKIEVSIRYTDKYVLSATASFKTFMLICCALVITIGACLFLAYVFIYPVLFFIAGIALIIAVAAFFGKKWRKIL